jgi:sugar phosphate isomerase/epimerase
MNDRGELPARSILDVPRLTLGWLTLGQITPEEVVDAAAAANFSSVSLRITPRGGIDPLYDLVGRPARIRDLRHRMDDLGLSLSNTSTYHLYPDVGMDVLAPALETTAELGCRLVVVTCNDPDRQRWLALMSDYSAFAATLGIRLAIEFVPYSALRTLGEADHAVGAVGASNLGILVDSLHLARSGGTPGDVKTIAPQRIFFAQLCDATVQAPEPDALASEARTGRLYPGDGGLPLTEFLEALPDGVELECETPNRLLADRTPAERAIAAGRAVRAYLTSHCVIRGKPCWN